MSNVAISTASVPENFCFINWQTSFPELVALLSGNLANVGTFVHKGSSPPTDLTLVWRRIVAGVPDRWYDYADGVWVSRHPAVPGTIIMWEGAQASIPVFDGGEAAAVTAYTGPMWEEVTQLQGRFPAGPGTLPSTAVIAVTNQGGEELHELSTEELAKHTHTVPDVWIRGSTRIDDGAGATFMMAYGNPTTSETGGETADLIGESKGHNNLPPYYGVFFLRRTARTHYRL